MQEPGAIAGAADRHFRIVALALLALGALLRLVLALRFGRHFFDVESYRFTAHVLRHYHLSAYQALQHSGGRWPYPPAYFPWMLAADALTGVADLSFAFFIKLPLFAADLGLAWYVQRQLGKRGLGAAQRLAAEALIALGPLVILDSGYRGQLDSLAVLPCVLAVVLWQERPSGTGRAVAAGALVGLGGALKTFPFVLLLALLPATRAHRDRLALAAGAIAVPLAMLLPFLAHGARPVIHDLNYQGLIGVGGLEMLIQPSLVKVWLHADSSVRMSRLTRLVSGHSLLVLAPALLIGEVLLFRRRTEPLTSSLIIWLIVFVFGVGFAPVYLVWAIPFFLLAGYILETAVIELLAVVPAALILHPPHFHGVVPLYVACSVMTWGALVVALVRRPGPAISTRP